MNMRLLEVKTFPQERALAMLSVTNKSVARITLEYGGDGIRPQKSRIVTSLKSFDYLYETDSPGLDVFLACALHV
ncbi:MAG: hypothetical protein V3U76_04545 [Granulosicoccus sp.]